MDNRPDIKLSLDGLTKSDYQLGLPPLGLLRRQFQTRNLWEILKMHKMTFFPLGNADCCLIELSCERTILMDFAATKDESDDYDLRCDLPELLKDGLKKTNRDYYDVVAFSHLDKDHFKGASQFFYLEHALKYQSGERIKINVMWVPAAFITEVGPDDDEARILQSEARYRFRQAKGIRVFSRPERLEEWCEKYDLKLDDRLHLITDAGKTAPEFSVQKDQIEFFVHSPFAIRQNDNIVEDRNEDSLVLHATFVVADVPTKALMLADSTHEVLSQIVDITGRKQNDRYLEWDIVKIPHHCSYLSIGPEKGTNKTTPVPLVAKLYEKRGQRGAIAVSTSKPIPKAGSDDDKDPQPPHRQAAQYYEDAINALDGQFVVTMEHPSRNSPKPMVIEIRESKATLIKSVESTGNTATSGSAPRAGWHR